MTVTEKREQKQWWYADVENGEAKEVTGYSCAPENPEAWWCPAIGVSAWEGQHLFHSPGQAHAQVRRALQEQIVKLHERLRKLAPHGGSQG